MRWTNSFVASMLAVAGILATTILAGNAQEDGHLTIENPGQPGDGPIQDAYRQLAAQMRDGYGLSDLAVARDYMKWQRYNRLPYLSATHGNRYVNSYANGKVRGYGALKAGERFAEGAVFAKDSFTVTKAGKVFPGALFVMEKLAGGASPSTADWRYVMIMPDGSLFGDSAGDAAPQVEYCHQCHIRMADQDFVFFVPEAFRTAPE